MSKLSKLETAADASRSDAVISALGTLKEIPENTLTLADLVDEQGEGTDLVGDVPAGADSPEPEPHQTTTVYSKQRNSTWRILEEQRMHSVEIAQECDGAIKLLESKRDDALAAAAACEVAQKTIEAR